MHNSFNQEKIFKIISKRTENQFCADCNYPSPTWASLDFGILICYQCSGFHRQLGPTISRVRSIQLDKWTLEFIEILYYVGNKKANEYWENQLIIENKIKQNNTDEEKKLFINEKYVKKLYIPNNETLNPVYLFLKDKKEGKISNFLHDIDNSAFLPKKPEKPQKFIPIQKRNKTPDKKNFAFDWNQGENLANCIVTKNPWENFNNTLFSKNIYNHRSHQNLLISSNKSQIPDAIIKNEEMKFDSSFKEFENFQAVSLELRNELLKGNPLERLKIQAEKK